MKTLKVRLILTGDEKRVIVFILAAFVLGLAVNYYRGTSLPARLDKKSLPNKIEPKPPARSR